MLPRIVNRLTRPLVPAAALLLATAGLGACSYVQPPALTIARDAASEPFFSYSADELFAELAKAASPEGGPSTTKPSSVDAQQVAELLTGKVRPRVLKQKLADEHVTPNDADRAVVEQASGQQQAQPSSEELDFRTDFVALGRVLADDFFSRPGNNVDDYARRFYDQRRSSFAQPAQTCMHVVTADAGDGQSPPTEAQYAEARPQADQLRSRLDREPFETVAESSGRSAQGIPDGDLGCRPDQNLPQDVVRAVAPVPVGTISEPLRWQAGWLIVRIDDRKPERTPPFDEVRDTAVQAAKLSFGQQFVNEVLDKANQTFVVKVDPRYGRWSAEQGMVLAPAGSATPTTPTTSTTAPTLDESPATTPPGTTAPGTAVPGTTPGSEPPGPATSTTSAP